MEGTDRDLLEILKFCKNFETQYLNTLRENANRLKQIAASAEASLGNTQFATVSSEKLIETSEALLKAAAEGEERIKEIERKTREDMEEKKEIEDLCL